MNTKYASGYNAEDFSPTGNNGLIFGDVEVTSDMNNNTGQAYTFDGDADFIEIDNPIQDDFTISFWLKTTQHYRQSSDQWYNGISLVDGKIGDGQNDFGVSMEEGEIMFGTGVPDTTIKIGEEYDDDSWHNVTVSRVKTSGTLKLFIDGFLVVSGTGGTESLSAPNLLRIGAAPFDEKYYQGRVECAL